MTPRQDYCLRVIRELTRGEVTPSYRQIADRMGIGVGATHALVQHLIEAGRVVNVGGARCLRLVTAENRPATLADRILQAQGERPDMDLRDIIIAVLEAAQ